MSYQKQNFSDGQVLQAEHLNHIEEGIAAVEKSIPTGIPEVTEADNGKFLKVVEGKWAAESVLLQMVELCNMVIEETFVSLTQSEYDALVAAGTVDANKYYLIVGDDE